MHPLSHSYALQKKKKARPCKSNVLAVDDALANYPLQRKSFLDRHGARPHARPRFPANKDHMDSLAGWLFKDPRWSDHMLELPLGLVAASCDRGPTRSRVVVIGHSDAGLPCFRGHHVFRATNCLAVVAHMNKSVGRPNALDFFFLS